MNTEEIIEELEELRKKLWNKSELHTDVEIDIELSKVIKKIKGEKYW